MVVVLVVAGVVICFVLMISGSDSNRLLSGFQPRSRIARRFDEFLAKDFFQTLFTRGKISLFWISSSKLILVRNNTNFVFSRTHSTLNDLPLMGTIW